MRETAARIDMDGVQGPVRQLLSNEDMAIEEEEQSMRYWYAYVPLHVAGSGGNRLIGKFQATRAEVDKHFAHRARINYQNGVIEIYKR